MRPDVETGWAADAVELRLVDAGLDQALATAFLVAARAQCADVVRLRGERADQERKVELAFMGEHDDRGRVVRLDVCERVFRPGTSSALGSRSPVAKPPRPS